MAKKSQKKNKGSKVTTGLAVVGVLAIAGAFVPEDDVRELPEDPPAIEETVEIEQPTIEETVEQVVPQKPAPVPEEKEEPSTAPAEPVAEPVNDTEPVAEPEPTIDPEQAFRESLKQYFLVGSSESDKYHSPTCRWTDTINDSNLVHFDSFEEAKAAGYVPCGTCGG